MRKSILIVDDEKNTREGIAKFLKSKGYTCFLADNGKNALKILSAQPVDLMITDIRMPALSGMDLIKESKQRYRQIPIIVLTAYGTVELAVEAVKNGADDFLEKPINLYKLDLAIRNILSAKDLYDENAKLKQQLDDRYGLENIIGNSNAMKKVFEIIRQVAPTKATILIQGESGTGKELVAKAIHQLSNRKNQRFVAVHCASLTETLLESELFGHEKGAFTGAVEQRIGRFEQADQGTFFLDEVSEISPVVQVKLLRVLQEQAFERVGGNKSISVDIRLIAATNKNLESEVKEGNFREDLFYRLSVVSINLPPLRNREEDIPLLLRHYLDYFAKENGKSQMEFEPEAVDLLKKYNWPGNIRELRNVIENIVVLSKKSVISKEDLPEKIISYYKNENHRVFESGINIKENEKNLIIKALEQSAGNRTKAAQALGMSRRTLYRKLAQYDLEYRY